LDHGRILLGFPDTTQDADISVEKTPANCAGPLHALGDPGFQITELEAAEIAPDGIERFEETGSAGRCGRHSCLIT
jgi:hypothetical protein